MEMTKFAKLFKKFARMSIFFSKSRKVLHHILQRAFKRMTSHVRRPGSSRNFSRDFEIEYTIKLQNVGSNLGNNILKISLWNDIHNNLFLMCVMLVKNGYVYE